MDKRIPAWSLNAAVIIFEGQFARSTFIPLHFCEKNHCAQVDTAAAPSALLIKADVCFRLMKVSRGRKTSLKMRGKLDGLAMLMKVFQLQGN